MSDWKNNRPPKWDEINPDPCKDCPSIILDDWGYFCDLACGKHTAYLNKEAGADAMLEAIKARGHILGESLRNVKGAIGWAGIDPQSKWYPIPDEESK